MGAFPVVETTGETVLKVGYEDATDAKTNWDLAVVMSVIPAKAGIQKKYLYVHQHTTHGKPEMIRKIDSRPSGPVKGQAIDWPDLKGLRGNDEVTLFFSFRTYETTSGRTPTTGSCCRVSHPAKAGFGTRPTVLT